MRAAFSNIFINALVKKNNIFPCIKWFHCGAITYDRLPMNKNVTDGFIQKLTLAVGEKNVSTSFPVREQSGTDEGHCRPAPADVVTYPQNVNHVSEIAKLCSSYSVPMVPRGTGTGLEHGTGALMGGVCLDLSQMTSIVNVNEEDFDCTVESGVTRKTLEAHLRDTGLMFPIDPGADASIGGMASTSASGTNAVRYGTMKENVLNLEVVLADGSILHTSGQNRRARKSSAGYNLTELFVGSEGTLGIITKVTLRLHAVPQMMVSAVCSFPSIGHAVQTAVEILQNSIPIARVELLDDLSMSIANAYNNLNYPNAPSLFLEFHGTDDSVKAQAVQVEEIVKQNEGSNFMWSNDPEERNKLWRARHNIYYAFIAHKPGYKCMITDACVPISRLTEIIVQTKAEIEELGAIASIIGHVGDGNFHTQMLFNPEKEKEFETVKTIEKSITKRALSMCGTCTGEHGIGRGKISSLEEEVGTIGINAMKSIKTAFDPHNLLNPGKILRNS